MTKTDISMSRNPYAIHTNDTGVIISLITYEHTIVCPPLVFILFSTFIHLFVL